ncbi:MAG: YbjN domain-containing protein [Verrucomicrobiales bacterium]|nr:YbjN domain-containing protein [Verrucomicrobiales bacterium]
MSPLFQTVQQAFQRMGWNGRQVEQREVLEADFEVYHTRVRLHVQAFPELSAVSVVATAPGRTPESRMGLVAEMLMRTNHELTVGNFELDYDTGQVLFRATNIFPESQGHPDIIGSLVHSALAEMDRLTPFLTLLLRMDTAELAKLNLKLFLQREDLLPPVPETPADSPI